VEMTRAIRQPIVWFGEHVNVALVLLIVIAGGALTFITIADQVVNDNTKHFDTAILRALRTPGNVNIPVGPPWLEEVASDVTALGGFTVLTLVTCTVVGYLLIVKKRHAMWLVLAAAVGGGAISTGLKELFHRARPDVVPHLAHVSSASFPSGHSMLSSAIYLTLGALLARLVPKARAKIYCLAVALGLTLCIGASRVYLGVHYPTDVLAGWMAGGVWALICWLSARHLQRQGAVERDIE
jgi:undecaprenyl-diphosphatase